MIKKYNKIKKVTIIGAGSWGTAVAKVIAEKRPDTLVLMWAYEKSTVNSINNKNINTEFLPGIRLPLNIKATAHLSESVNNTQGIIIATPSKVIPETVSKLSRLISNDVPLAYLTKGFCRIGNEILTISQTISKIIPGYGESITAIYGPSHAEEVVNYYHTCLTIAGKSGDDRKLFADLLNCDYISCRETSDIIGVDLGGTLKNPAAIAAGIISNLPRCGDNLAGALLSESLIEMIRLGKFMGGGEDTIIDISGTGDLVATALSDHSRNRRFGKDIARQILEKGTTLTVSEKIYLRLNPEYVLEKMAQKLHYLAEGAYAIEPLIELAERNSIPIPVYRSLYEVLLNKKEPSLLIETIKNPERFNEIYATSKIHVKEKKKGLEKIKGKVFKKIILSKVYDKYLSFKKQGDGIDFLIRNLKASIGCNEEKNCFKKELKLIVKLTEQNSDKYMKKLSSVYLKEISDHNNFIISSVFFKLMDFIYYFNRLTGKKNRIKITGETHRVFNFRERYNTLYVMRHKNIFDFIYYMFAIRKGSMPLPRFFVPDKVAKTFFRKFILKRSGGFIVHTRKLDNLIYRECLIQYLSTLISHGVPVLFFPELKPAAGSEAHSLSENFFQLLNEVMYQESTEIALVPASILYNNLVNESEIKPVLREAATINFSNPVFLSDFTTEASTVNSITGYINNLWMADEIILPQHILCGIIAENNNIIKTDRLKKNINRYMNSRNLVFNKNAKHIFHDGLKFLIRNGIVIKKDNYIMGIDTSLIQRYSSLIDNKYNSSLKTANE